ncbi:MAG: TRAP transporter small permease subunit [Dehalococcoidales bacterium]
MKLLSVIEAISLWSGKAVSLILLALIGVITYEVVARYVFDAPTTWAYETIVFSAGTLFVIGGAYTYHLRGHVIVDIVYNMFSPRTKACLDIFVCFTFFLVYVGVVLSMGGIAAWESIILNEHTGSFWDPPLYPVKAMAPIGFFLILLQGLAKLIRDVKTVITGKADI